MILSIIMSDVGRVMGESLLLLSLVKMSQLKS
jgi:hypothetical protein